MPLVGTQLGDTSRQGTRMDRGACPLGTPNWGIRPSQGHVPLGGEMDFQGVPKGRRANPFLGDTLLGVMSLRAANMARGTHPRETQAPCTHMCPVPHLRVPVLGHLPLPHVPPGPHPHGLPPCPVQQLGTSLQWGAPSSVSPQLWEGIILVATGGWDICGAPLKLETRGVAPQTPHPHIPLWTMPGWVGRAARGVPRRA